MRRSSIALAALLAGAGAYQAIAQTVDGLDLDAIKRRSSEAAGDADAFVAQVQNRGDAFREDALAAQSQGTDSLSGLTAKHVPQNGEGPVDFDEIIEGASQNVAARKGEAPQLIVFASLSMPPPALRQLIADTGKAGGIVVFRGFPNNSFKAFSAALSKVVTERDQLSNVGIDPRLFRAFAVTAVPTYVAVSSDFDLCSGFHCTTQVPPHDRMTGNVSVGYVLETFAGGNGPGAGVAAVALRNLSRAS
ncbi:MULTISPECIES: type-F conjugative transfer system pilin assembly protein TrbC [unclassified Novosphingobium]|uniref:type-F conjugative transfer system pilin assembly protein TrbC n=1 Tax=unclassified Novosphingobium TaxID=2644732 RepID=UPI001044D205|nr:type-F conjugative transfer system pilin assembly protein TrbC [Novosphingobium sp. ST904]TCM28097.1 conjugal transfer pilus assembly protein TrbC [Novosphingobium sp. ST904]